MPGKPRRDLMNPEEIETHHLWSRCVGRAYLFGVDPLTGVDYSHRMEWLESLAEHLTSIFAVELGDYHWMSNHIHEILRNRPDVAQTWSDEEVAWRWKCAWPRLDNGRWARTPTDQEIEELLQRGREQEGYLPWVRRNLADISWYQARLKETIAKACNNETSRRGHHWEARYGNRKLETPEEVTGGFLYLDMQKLRAGMVDDVKDSDHSAIQRQIRSHAERAFQDTFGRPPDGREQDAELLEGLQQLFSNCFLSPIDAGGPLLTVKEQEVPPSELVLPQGYLYERGAPTPEPVDEGADDEEVVVAGSDGEGAEAREQRQAGDEQDHQAGDCRSRRGRRRRGRPPRRRRYTIHRRLRLRQRRRASRSSILGIPWEQYSDLLQRLAQQELAERPLRPPRQEEDLPPGAAPDSCSPTSFRAHVSAFGAWLRAAATRLPRRLAKRLLPASRGDPPPD